MADNGNSKPDNLYELNIQIVLSNRTALARVSKKLRFLKFVKFESILDFFENRILTLFDFGKNLKFKKKFCKISIKKEICSKLKIYQINQNFKIFKKLRFFNKSKF